MTTREVNQQTLRAFDKAPAGFKQVIEESKKAKRPHKEETKDVLISKPLKKSEEVPLVDSIFKKGVNKARAVLNYLRSSEVVQADAKKAAFPEMAFSTIPTLQKPREVTGQVPLINLLKRAEKKQYQVQRKAFDELGDAEIELMSYEMHLHQIDLYKKEGMTLRDGLIQGGIEKRRLWSKYLELVDEARDKQKSSKIFNWISFGGGVIGGAVFVGGLLTLVVGSGGTALPGLITAAGGLASITSAGTRVSGAIYNYQGNVIVGESMETREKQKTIHDKILENLQDIESNDRSIVQISSRLASLLENHPQDILR